MSCSTKLTLNITDFHFNSLVKMTITCHHRKIMLYYRSTCSVNVTTILLFMSIKKFIKNHIIDNLTQIEVKYILKFFTDISLIRKYIF